MSLFSKKTELPQANLADLRTEVDNTDPDVLHEVTINAFLESKGDDDLRIIMIWNNDKLSFHQKLKAIFSSGFATGVMIGRRGG